MGEAPLRIVIRADASSSIGIGHVMRTLALAAAFRNAGHYIAYASRTGVGELAQALVEGHGFDFIEVPAANEDDALAILAHRADLVIVDHYGLGAEWWAPVGASSRLVVIDDWGRDGIGDYAHAIINHNIGAEELVYTGSALKLLGSRFAMLRPALLELEVSAWGRRPGSVLMSMGGSDILAVTPPILRALLQATELTEAHVVVGPGFPAPCVAEIEAIATGDSRVVLHHRPSNLTDLLRLCAVYIGTASSAIYEAAYLQTPLVVFTVADNQERIAASLRRAGAALVMGWVGDESIGRLSGEISALLADDERRQVLIPAAAAMVDGRGCERLVESLVSLIPGSTR
jgi:UDP-2,4-diacetamido-2,4,6-trideoxy-beta-L-altropyranose hydrolase